VVYVLEWLEVVTMCFYYLPCIFGCVGVRPATWHSHTLVASTIPLGT